ncbi:MAG: hypothetical protein ACJ8FP_14030 [Xanthobacteraceae bacterium]|jgi:DICT domain-containing protein
MPRTFDVKYWRDRAAETRAIAQRLEDSETRRILREIASRYEELADRAVDVLVLPKKQLHSPGRGN